MVTIKYKSKVVQVFMLSLQVALLILKKLLQELTLSQLPMAMVVLQP